MDEEQSKAISRVETGIQRSDIGMLSWGASQLSELSTRMSNERPLWTDHQIEEVQPHFVRARQATIQYLPDWLARQCPVAETPDAVGDFKHKMLRLVGGNLKKLGLDELYQELEAHTNQVVRNVETAVEARQLIRDVQFWLTSNQAKRFVRVAELRDQHQVGKDFASKLQGLSMRIQMPELGEVRSRLSVALGDMKNAEAGIVKRAQRLWKSKVSSQDDVESLLAEVDALTSAFENRLSDLEDLQLMRRALRMYQNDYQRLSNDRLSWHEFEALAANCKSEARSALGEEEIPWAPEETIDGFVAIISERRKQASSAWIDSLEVDAGELVTMSAADANRLHARASNAPAVLTKSDAERLYSVIREIEARLDTLKIEWLVERFKELPLAMRRKFLDMIAQAA